MAFGTGLGLASVIGVFGLGYGARLAAPIFARPRAWQILDTLIGVVMLVLAARLVAEAWPAPP